MTKGSKKTRSNTPIWRHLAEILTFCMEIDPQNVVLLSIWLLASVCVDCLCHFCAQPDGIQQKMAKAFKRTRSKAPNSLNLAQIWTFPMKIDQKRRFVANFGTCQHFCGLSLSFLCSG